MDVIVIYDLNHFKHFIANVVLDFCQLAPLCET